ncbi:MAG: hypothetical protein ACPGJV_07455 [Bacteriovoracaceae bacterium]
MDHFTKIYREEKIEATIKEIREILESDEIDYQNIFLSLNLLKSNKEKAEVIQSIWLQTEENENIQNLFPILERTLSTEFSFESLFQFLDETRLRGALSLTNNCARLITEKILTEKRINFIEQARLSFSNGGISKEISTMFNLASDVLQGHSINFHDLQKKSNGEKNFLKEKLKLLVKRKLKHFTSIQNDSLLSVKWILQNFINPDDEKEIQLQLVLLNEIFKESVNQDELGLVFQLLLDYSLLFKQAWSYDVIVEYSKIFPDKIDPVKLIELKSLSNNAEEKASEEEVGNEELSEETSTFVKDLLLRKPSRQYDFLEVKEKIFVQGQHHFISLLSKEEREIIYKEFRDKMNEKGMEGPSIVELAYRLVRTFISASDYTMALEFMSHFEKNFPMTSRESEIFSDLHKRVMRLWEST